MAENITHALPGQVVIAVIGQIDHGGLIRLGLVANLQFIVIGERVDDRAVQIARISFFTVYAQIGQLHPYRIGSFYLLSVPHHFVKSLSPAVNVVRPVVGRELVLDAVEHKSGPAYAISVSANGRPEKRTSFDVSVKRIVTEGDIGELAVPIRDLQRN